MNALRHTLKNHSVLTALEDEIMVLLAKGYLCEEIAEKLAMNFPTLHFHLHHIFQKLPSGNRSASPKSKGVL